MFTLSGARQSIGKMTSVQHIGNRLSRTMNGLGSLENDLEPQISVRSQMIRASHWQLKGCTFDLRWGGPRPYMSTLTRFSLKMEKNCVDTVCTVVRLKLHVHYQYQ